MDNKEYNYQVYATQGGGLVRLVGWSTYVFVEAPEMVPSLQVGDVMPDEWGIISVNRDLEPLCAFEPDDF